MDKLSIVVCCHKKDPAVRTGYPYVPVHAGKALHPDLDLGFAGDDTGDNISLKNPQWCEQTSLYWAWKNLPRTTYFGLAHYRRYLDVDTGDDAIDSLMADCDIVVSKGLCCSNSLASGLMYLCNREDFWIFADTLVSMYPDAGDAVIDYFFNSNYLYPCSMFICRRELMDEYCGFMMPVLEETEKRLLSGGYSRQRRAIAYMAEFMLGFYITYRKLRVKEAAICHTEEGKPVSGHRTFKSAFSRKAFFTLERWMKNAYFRCFCKVRRDSFIVADEDVIRWLANDGIRLRVLDRPFYHSRRV